MRFTETRHCDEQFWTGRWREEAISSHVWRECAQVRSLPPEASYFFLDEKVTKKSSRKNRSALQAFALGPGFPAGLYAL